MYGLPDNFDASIFLTKKLDLLCYSENTINLSFEGALSVTILRSFIHKRALHETACKQTLPVSKSSLMCLVGKVVCHVASDKQGSLTLNFDNGHVLELFDDSQNYESYIIRIGETEVIV